MKNAAVLRIEGQTALQMACQRGRFRVVEVFMENAATLSVNAVDKTGLKSFHYRKVASSSLSRLVSHF